MGPADTRRAADIGASTSLASLQATDATISEEARKRGSEASDSSGHGLFAYSMQHGTPVITWTKFRSQSEHRRTPILRRRLKSVKHFPFVWDDSHYAPGRRAQIVPPCTHNALASIAPAALSPRAPHTASVTAQIASVRRATAAIGMASGQDRRRRYTRTFIRVGAQPENRLRPSSGTRAEAGILDILTQDSPLRARQACDHAATYDSPG